MTSRINGAQERCGRPMNGWEWRQVPVRIDAKRWSTRTGCKKVLVVVYTATSGQRLAGILRLFESDLRIQVIFTAAPDVFGNGVSTLLRELDGIVIPWAQAIATTFDLALAAAYGGLHELHAPVVVIPHGAGYNNLAVRRGDRDRRRHTRRVRARPAEPRPGRRGNPRRRGLVAPQ